MKHAERTDVPFFNMRVVLLENSERKISFVLLQSFTDTVSLYDATWLIFSPSLILSFNYQNQ